jgi:glutathione S-transferase
VTEGPVIVQIIADQAFGKALAPARDSNERYGLEWLNFLASELHESFGPPFAPALNDEAKPFLRAGSWASCDVDGQPAAATT